MIYSQKQNTAQKKDADSAASVLDNSSQRESLQRKADMASIAVQREERPNNTGMPDNLKSGIESLSGFSMDNVRVHYNSSKPATVQALAYTQGTDIHVAPGQEKCLPHEAWHVAQQMAGRVSPTTNINGMPVNDNAALEHEADIMGEKAVAQRMNAPLVYSKCLANCGCINTMIQCVAQRTGKLNIKEFIAYIISKNKPTFQELYNGATSTECQNMIVRINQITRIDKSWEKRWFNESSDEKKLKKFLKDLPDDFSKLSVSGKKVTEKNLEKEVNDLFEKIVPLLSKIIECKLKKSKDYYENLEKLKTFLNESMICYVCGRRGETKNICDFMDMQIEMYDGMDEHQISAMILCSAKMLSYVLGDPWAENRLARLLNEKIEEKIGPQQVYANKLFFNKVSGFARSNPVLMYVNQELNEQDACHLIHVRSVRIFGKDNQESYDNMFEKLRCDAYVTLISMGKSGALLNDGKNFSPSTLGMFRLYRENKDFEEKEFEEKIGGLKSFDVTHDDGFVKINSSEWLKNADKNFQEEMRVKLVDKAQKEKCEKIYKSLIDAPITIRLHSANLKYQKNGFYHARPWFSSVKIGKMNVPFHPAVERDESPHYSLWRTYKDHFYRGMLWKRGRDGLPSVDADEQSIDKGAVQQSFGALNFNYKKNCYGLMCDYNYGNVSLVLKDSINNSCIYTIGDKGLAYPHRYGVAHALARYSRDSNTTPNPDISGNIINSAFFKIVNAIEKGCLDNNEALEVQIFKDIKFGKNGDISEIHCVGVKRKSKEYKQLLAMVGGDSSKVHCY